MLSFLFGFNRWIYIVGALIFIACFFYIKGCIGDWQAKKTFKKNLEVKEKVVEEKGKRQIDLQIENKKILEKYKQLGEEEKKKIKKRVKEDLKKNPKFKNLDKNKMEKLFKEVDNILK